MYKNKLEKTSTSKEVRTDRTEQIRTVGMIPVNGIIPPHILKEIAKKGSQKQKDMAMRTLMMSEKMRGRREAFAEVYVAASTGAKCIRVYDAKNQQDLPGEDPVIDPGNSTDPAIKEAYDGADTTYNLYFDVYERNSIDDRGMCIMSTVHFDANYNNAFWDGRQMVYGDGDGDLFNRFTIAIDVIGHELTHGVTEYEAGLVYYDQPGALNESMSDVFGTLVKQRILDQTVDAADWLIGEGLFTSKVNGTALRSMKAPGTAYDDPVIGKDPQPAHMKQYVKLPRWDDGGGVHINSGIPNHAFYLTAMEIGGYAWEKAGKIWYIVLRDMLRYNSGFQSAADSTFQVARILYGSGSKEELAVKKGWAGVGITPRIKK